VRRLSIFSRRFLVVSSSLAVGLVVVGVISAQQGPPPPPPPPPAGAPFPGIGQNEFARWNAGKAAFLQPANPPGGLGPVFTENACAKCHNAPAPGGSGPRLVTRIGRIVNGQFDPVLAFGGPQIQNNGIGPFNGVNFVGEVVPPQATIVAQRRTIPLFGLGLVDAVPDSTFAWLAQEELETSPHTAGTPAIVVDPLTGRNRVGKFGWKAQEATLFAFAGDASVNELGVTSPLFPNENCPQGNCALLAANPARTHPNDTTNAVLQQLADFMTFTAPPPRGPLGPAATAGSIVFNQVQCGSCHTPLLQTGPSPSPELNNVVFAPFSDYLLHDMGTLGDGIVQGAAGPTQMRTAPLWGLRFEASFLHDGRAANVDEAIRDHAGQALASRNLYLGLNATQRAQLLAYLNSL
jgi:CxxC motif-containing protein (DUF1111 family)